MPPRIVAVRGDDLVLLSSRSGRVLRTLLEGVDPATRIAVSPDGTTVFFDHGPAPPYGCNATEVSSMPTMGGPAHRVGYGVRPVVSPDGHHLAMSLAPTCGQLVVIRDLSTDSYLTWGGGPPVDLVPLGWSGDSTHVLVAAARSSVTLFYLLERTSSVQPLPSVEVPIAPVDQGAVVPAGFLGETGLLAAVRKHPARRCCELVALDPTTGRVVRTLVDAGDKVTTNVFAADASGSHILLSPKPGTLARWSNGDEKPTKIADGVGAAAWVPGGLRSR